MLLVGICFAGQTIIQMAENIFASPFKNRIHNWTAAAFALKKKQRSVCGILSFKKKRTSE